MAGGNLENLRRGLEEWSRHPWTVDDPLRVEPLEALLDPEVLYEDTVLPDHGGELYRGQDGIQRALARWFEPFEFMQVELKSIVGADDRFVSTHGWRAKARHTGIEFDGPLIYVWTFRDGRIVHIKSFTNEQRAVAEAGV